MQQFPKLIDALGSLVGELTAGEMATFEETQLAVIREQFPHVAFESLHQVPLPALEGQH